MSRVDSKERALFECQPVLFVWTSKLKGEVFQGGVLRVADRRRSLVRVDAPRFGGKRSLKALGSEGRLIPLPLVLLGDGLQDGGREISLILPEAPGRAVSKAVFSGVVTVPGGYLSLDDEIPALLLPPLCLVEPAVSVRGDEAEGHLAKAKDGAILLRRRAAGEVSFVPIILPPRSAPAALPEISQDELIKLAAEEHGEEE